MKKIKLFNRDGANLWLEKGKKIDSNIFEWELKVDNKHKYCRTYNFNYLIFIFKFI